MAPHMIPPIYKPRVSMDFLESMNIIPNLETAKKSANKRRLGKLRAMRSDEVASSQPASKSKKRRVKENSKTSPKRKSPGLGVRYRKRRGLAEEKSFFVQKKFSKRFCLERFRDLKGNEDRLQCDKKMDEFASRANKIGLET